MNDNKRTRRKFQPEVDSLEGRLVLSSGVSPNAAGVAHLQQLQEQRHTLQVQRVEHRQQMMLVREEAKAAQMPQSRKNKAAQHTARFVFASGANFASGVSSVVVGTPFSTTNSSSPASSSSQASATVGSAGLKKV